MARLLMGNAEWAFFEQFITGTRGRGGRPAGNHCQVLDGVCWIARTGSLWRDLPEDFGKWSSVYRQFKRWMVAGPWDLILNALNESEAMPDQVQMIRWSAGVSLKTLKDDSTTIRAHQQAAGAIALSVIAGNHLPVDRGIRGKVLAVQTPLDDVNIICRAAGGFTMKIQVIANFHGLSMKAEISGGEVFDYKGFNLLRVDPLKTPKVFIADKGYDPSHIRDTIAADGGTPVIPARTQPKSARACRSHYIRPAKPRRALL